MVGATPANPFIATQPDALRPGARQYEVTELIRAYCPSAPVRLSECDDRERAILTGLVVSLKSQGFGYREIRKMTKLGADSVMRILREAREKNALVDVLADLDMECVPLAVDNVRRYLRKPWTEQGERATFEILEGRGQLAKHQKTANVNANMTFEVKYTNAPAIMPAATGTIVSCPRED